jgi:hypothetical protein
MVQRCEHIDHLLLRIRYFSTTTGIPDDLFLDTTTARDTQCHVYIINMYHRRHKTTQLGAPFAVVIGPIVQYANRTPVFGNAADRAQLCTVVGSVHVPSSSESNHRELVQGW